MAATRITISLIIPMLLFCLAMSTDLKFHPWTLQNDICPADGSSRVRILSLEEVPRYQAVEYLVRHDLEYRPEVRDMNLTYDKFYAHVFAAFSLVNGNALSLVAVDDKAVVIGVNLVLQYSQLSHMFAPDPIYKVLEFVRNCYRSMMGEDVSDVWIRILEGSSTSKAHCALLRRATRNYLHLPAKNRKGYLLWASATDEGLLLQRLGYKLLTCGGHGGSCDWMRLGIPQYSAKDICLFAL